ncbi:SDR family NAD(P)-dependent oxidoreductase [Paenibacillus nasutitermitis]|uniref:Short-chain dehydrogenase n=1 Tax=Paenibacillus nasutitermitis TaxID=1652958 RepID=A0A917E042_9BACL|nr:SDR family NAD(P)-dependent oxidoreductase [Paenibacillus nasutitermitis]GGD89638.1 short-chain dehydrogenase [Paenibacillus nasutitermitis]
MEQIKDRVALVTGANRGIGKEISRQLALMGLRVIIACRDEWKGKQVVDEMRADGIQLDLLTVDISDKDSVQNLIQAVRGKYGRLDVLVNNAGVLLDHGTSLLELEEAVLRQTLETNFYGALRLSQGFYPMMVKQGYGRIVNVSSGVGAFDILQGKGGLRSSSSAYRMSKTMLNALTCLLAAETMGADIKVNAMCPGRVKTDMGGADAPSSVAEGADTAVWLAALDQAGPNGQFFRSRQPISW